ncbi:cytochrome P450 [Actinoplanes sp. NBRC 103695]|uniref:cytochrome P450 n=1 Tax=Actinoplanes sp. NBRC 103695 TaxID=3032202 RepID=UPI0024A4D4D8|nr:cytochrome P450 [Actinoplanes sp. NBRC 103695]GLY93098.1 cytochrome P450 [Actinoplanes sp. NBRC 103695]
MPENTSILDGPRPLPFVGNLPEFARDQKTHRVLERWADEYGLTYRFRLGRQEVVATADPAHVDVLLRRRPDDFRRAVRSSTIIDEIVPRGVFTAEGDRWRRLRKVATQSLNAAYLRQYFTTITMVTERLLRQWEAAAGSGARVDVLDLMMRYTLDVTVGLAMGHDLNALESTGDGLHTRVKQLFPAISRRINAALPYWRYAKLPQDRRLDATVREIEALVGERFAAARVRVAAGDPPSNFLEALVRPLENEPEITDEEVFGNVLAMLLGGEDTTSSTAAWALHYLAENPDIHAKVRAEADEVLGEQRLPGDPGTVGRLKYAEAVVNEVLRFQPVAPFLLLEPTSDVTLTGRDGSELFAPKGLPIFVLMSYGARRDTERFGDPDVFRPERWLEGKLPPEALPFAPFGAGPRYCPGRNLALIEAAMVTSVLGREFDFEPDHSAGAVVERMEFTTFPTNLNLRVRTRAATATR